jgi:hypothetical protein
MFLAVSLDTSNFWIQFVAGIAVAGGAIWAILRFLGHRIADIAADKSGVAEVTARLERIEAQYRTNGGGSMKDAINRIERALDRTGDEMVLLRRDLQRMEIETSRIKGYLEGQQDAE